MGRHSTRPRCAVGEDAYRRALASLLAVGALAGCATANWPPGTGWSRASDLSVYTAMLQFGGIEREQQVLCGGFGTESVDRHWRADFAARTDAVTRALLERHGEAKLVAAEAAAAPARRVPCDSIPTGRWRDSYARLLRLLETRLGLA
jgi:hypothetical protein